MIKNPKKMEEKVLPHFFRHKHISSFVRQLNMYSFNKVHKVPKERNHTYFKNEHFQKDILYLSPYEATKWWKSRENKMGVKVARIVLNLIHNPPLIKKCQRSSKWSVKIHQMKSNRISLKSNTFYSTWLKIIQRHHKISTKH